MIQDVGNEVFFGSIPLRLLASSYIAIDVNGQSVLPALMVRARPEPARELAV
jgi:hypothetical protein